MRRHLAYLTLIAILCGPCQAQRKGRARLTPFLATAYALGYPNSISRILLDSVVLPEGPDLYRYLIGELNKLGLAYVHLLHLGNEALVADIRKGWSNGLIVNRPGRAPQDVGADITAGLADLESYGQFVLTTPDFAERLKSGAPMNPANKATFYGGGAEGYTDYPTLANAMAPAL